VLNPFQIVSKGALSLLRDLPLWLQFRVGLRTSADIDDAVSYALALADIYLHVMKERGVAILGARVLELGPGLDFAPQLALASHGAHVMLADRFLVQWDAAYHPEFYRRFKARWNGPSAAIDKVIAVGGYPASVLTCMAEPAEMLTSVADASCDVVLSNAVLEHIYDLPAVCRSLARVTKSGGIGVHQVDFRDHWDFARPLEFLLFEPRSYQARVTRGRVGRGNRHRLSDHLAQFRAAGFRIEKVDANQTADKAYLEAFLPRLRASSSPYHDRAEKDLAVLSARITMVRSIQDESKG
jgi:SAM-dependent methyltransferase